MFMLFSTKDEFKGFLQRMTNWRKWVKNMRDCGDKVFIGKEINDSYPLTNKEIDELMK